MKLLKLLFVSACMLLAVFAPDVSARDIDKSFTGSWYNPAQSGHGFSVEVLPDGRAIIYWYVYNPDGTPTFLIAIGNVEGETVHATVYHHTGMPFGTFDNTNLVQTEWGTLDFTVHDCDSATLSYASTMSIDGQPFGSDSIPLQRLASVAGNKCTATPLQGNMHASIVQPDGHVATGLGMMFADGDMVFFGADITGASVVMGQWEEGATGNFSFSATVYDILGGAMNVSGSGYYFEDGFTASYTGGGELLATRLPSFQRDLSYETLAGVYDVIDPIFGSIGSVTVADDGSASGSTIDGCLVSGSFSIPDPNFNQAYFDGTISDCADAGTITGAGSYDFDVDGIMVAGTDGEFGIVLYLQR
jgi:hypothetical protein